MATDFDAVVIGSGFGGAVSALRLAEGNYRVLVLERGRRWHRLEYPSITRKDWLWDEAHPEQTNGWLDIRNHGNISTVAAAGVGGGSLHFANVVIGLFPRRLAAGDQLPGAGSLLPESERRAPPAQDSIQPILEPHQAATRGRPRCRLWRAV